MCDANCRSIIIEIRRSQLEKCCRLPAIEYLRIKPLETPLVEICVNGKFVGGDRLNYAVASD